MDQRFKKSEILKGQNNFREVYLRGIGCDGVFMCTLYVKQKVRNQNAPRFRVGFAVNSKSYPAVRRNRLKRLMREAFRKMRGRFVQGLLEYQLSIIFSPKTKLTALPTHAEIYSDMETILQKILRAEANDLC